jgi:hypothetical protein
LYFCIAEPPSLQIRPELAALAAAGEMPVSMFRALPGNFNRM